MKIAGSSRKDGMTLYGPHVKVRVTVAAPGEEPVVEVTKRKTADAVGKTGAVPVLRGVTGLILNNGPMAAMLGMQALIEIQEIRGKKHRLLTAANLALSGYFLYRIFGNVDAVRKFHGAEHKVIGAKEQDLAIDLEHVKTVSRISDRCGTNFVGFYVPAQLITALLPLPSDTLKALLAMGLAYEGFRLDRKKYKTLVGPFYKLGAKAQEYVTTAEPDEEQLNAAIAAMEALIAAEQEYSA